MYEVYLEHAAEKDLKKLPADIFYRIISYIKTLAENPRPVSCKKISGSKSDWRIRVGDYRIVYEIDENDKAVRVMVVKHRREVYR
ncbi:MAG: type II toxin-antitoxin system RelE/ParE family toxin [Candidatus Schekmanbacteria bacterium]|nr:type II toxin-antitoxin system RelE/ParE family toxin [Candidatus Schekmanbacteria bacterium]